MLSPAEFRAKVEAHLEATGTAPSMFGLRVLGDPNFIRDLRQGREPRFRNAQKVLAEIDGATAPAHAAVSA